MPDPAERERIRHQGVADFLIDAQKHLTRAVGVAPLGSGFYENDHWDGAETAIEEAIALLGSLVRGRDDATGMLAVRRVRELQALIADYADCYRNGRQTSERTDDDMRTQLVATITVAFAAAQELRHDRGFALDPDVDDLLDQ